MRGDGLRVLVAEDEPSVRGMLVELLRHEGYEAIEAADGEAAVALFERDPADIVVTDVRMPGLDGLGVLSRVKRREPETCVVVMTGYGTEETAVEALRRGASNYFKKPVAVGDFIYVLGALGDLVRTRRADRPDPAVLVRETRTLRLGPNPGAVSPAIAALTGTLAGLPFDLQAVRIGLLEMLTNAIEHGSLGITREEKLAALRAGTIRELIARRAAEAPGRDRRVLVESELTPRAAAFTIVDEGEGFDWRGLPDPREAENVLADAGRGIVIARLCLDEVEYRGRGNEVRIVKRAGLPAD